MTAKDNASTDFLMGACVVYKSSSTEEDTNNGAVCHGVAVDSAVSSSMATNGHFLFRIPRDKWVSEGDANVTSSTLDKMKLTDVKYAAVYNPAQSSAV